MKLTENFYLSEFLKNSYGYKLNPSEWEIKNIKRLCMQVLQPMRSEFDTPIKITSGLRNIQLNADVGGRPHSHHLSGYAADFQTDTNYRLVKMFIMGLRLRYTQMILYLKETEKNFIHVSYIPGRETQRGTMIWECGKFYNFDFWLNLTFGN